MESVRLNDWRYLGVGVGVRGLGRLDPSDNQSSHRHDSNLWLCVERQGQNYSTAVFQRHGLDVFIWGLGDW